MSFNEILVSAPLLQLGFDFGVDLGIRIGNVKQAKQIYVGSTSFKVSSLFLFLKVYKVYKNLTNLNKSIYVHSNNRQGMDAAVRIEMFLFDNLKRSVVVRCRGTS